MAGIAVPRSGGIRLGPFPYPLGNSGGSIGTRSRNSASQWSYCADGKTGQTEIKHLSDLRGLLIPSWNL